MSRKLISHNRFQNNYIIKLHIKENKTHFRYIYKKHTLNIKTNVEGNGKQRSTMEILKKVGKAMITLDKL